MKLIVLVLWARRNDYGKVSKLPGAQEFVRVLKRFEGMLRARPLDSFYFLMRYKTLSPTKRNDSLTITQISSNKRAYRRIGKRDHMEFDLGKTRALSPNVVYNRY